MCTLQSREQRKIEAIEKTFEKIEQRQKSGKQRGAGSENGVEPDKPNRVSVDGHLTCDCALCVCVSVCVLLYTAKELSK